MKRTIEIDDNLQELVNGVTQELEEYAIGYVKEHGLDCDDSPPDLYDELDYSGGFHEIVDSFVPIYYSELDDLFYLHKNELVSAYEDAGIGDNPLEKEGMLAVYCYLEQQASQWYQENSRRIFDSCFAKADSP